MAIVVQRPRLTWYENLYLPGIFIGLLITLRHFFEKKYTVQYPEQKWALPAGYRGVHRLNKDEEGRIRCVACEMCSTACPAHCITIEAEKSPWPDKEKVPKRYEINMLHCIFCGMCEEACPEDAIELTYIHDLSGTTRKEFIWDKEKLLSMYDETARTQPR